MTHIRINRFSRPRGASILSVAAGLLALTACAEGDASPRYTAFGDEGLGDVPDPASDSETSAWDEEETGTSEAGPLLDLPSGETGDDLPCESEFYAWDPVRPQVMFVLDHSGSMDAGMDDPLGGVWSRWAALHEVVRLTLERRQEEVEFGLKVFPTPSLAPADLCAVDPMVEAEPAPMAMQSLLDVLPPADSQPIGSTPIHAGLKAAGEALLAADAQRPRAILLVADGGISASCGADENADDASAYLQNLRISHGIDSFVVAVGPTAGQAPSLQALSAAGGLGYVFESDDSLELDAAIGQVVDSVRSCEVQLVAPYPMAGEVQPLVDGDALVEGESCTDADFTYDADTGRLTLCDSACDAYFEGASVEIENACQPD